MLIPPLISYVILILMMTVLWFVFRRINNAAIVDFGWGFGFVLVGLVYLVAAPGLIERRILLSFLMVLWGEGSRGICSETVYFPASRRMEDTRISGRGGKRTSIESFSLSFNFRHCSSFFFLHPCCSLPPTELRHFQLLNGSAPGCGLLASSVRPLPIFN